MQLPYNKIQHMKNVTNRNNYYCASFDMNPSNDDMDLETRLAREYAIKHFYDCGPMRRDAIVLVLNANITSNHTIIASHRGAAQRLGLRMCLNP